MKYILLLFVVVLATSAQAQSMPPLIPPPSLGNTLDPVDGIVLIGWENGIEADAVVASLDRDDCRIATQGTIGDFGDPQQVITQVPSGPPFNPLCLLRPGDHVYIERWREGMHVDTIGPYNVPLRVWLPAVTEAP